MRKILAIAAIAGVSAFGLTAGSASAACDGMGEDQLASGTPVYGGYNGGTGGHIGITDGSGAYLEVQGDANGTGAVEGSDGTFGDNDDICVDENSGG